MSRFCFIGLIVLAAMACPALGQAKADAPTKTKSDTAAKAKPRATANKQAPQPDAIPGYKILNIEGFTVVVSDETMKNQESSTYERKPLEVLELEFKAVTRLLKPEAVNVLRGLLIWVEWEEKHAMANGRQGNAAAVYYGGHQLQMLSKGLHPLKAKNITILSMRSLTEEHQPKRDSGRCVVLHEMTHAVHDQFMGNDNPMIEAAYKQAMERKLYDPSMYASTNEHEFFAELTCAYFDQNGYYPRTRADLEKHDPWTYQLMENVWGKRTDAAASAAASQAATSATLQVKLDGIDLGKPIMGPTMTKSDLHGRPAIIVLWNANSTSSMACFQKLNTWDAELSDFGLASIAVHLTGSGEQDVKAAAESRSVSFTVTEGRWTKGGPIDDFKQFPLAFVFDHKGACVFRGSPFDAEASVRTAVGEALIDGSGVETFPKAMASQVEALRKGKPPAAVLPQLIPHTRSGDDATKEAAKKLVDQIVAVAPKVFEQAESMAKDDPVGAYLKLDRVARVFKGTPIAVKANGMLGKLRREKIVVTELRAQPALVTVRKLEAELSSKPGSFDPKFEDFRKENASLLQQLQETVVMMKSSWPTTRATQEAVRTADRFGVAVQ